MGVLPIFGGDNAGYYSAFGGYNWADYGYEKRKYGTTLFQGLRYTSYANDGVTWEIATKHDIGLDMSLFDDKFTLTIDYFHEDRKGHLHVPVDIFLPQQV